MPLLWLLPAAMIPVTGYFVRDGWVITTTWTASLLLMGTACLMNARGCGRIHCFFTGPFFLVMAAASLLHGLQLLPLGTHGWRYIGMVLISGGVLLYFVPEWICGRYRHTATVSA
jgi:hypothetical protein